MCPPAFHFYLGGSQTSPPRATRRQEALKDKLVDNNREHSTVCRSADDEGSGMNTATNLATRSASGDGAILDLQRSQRMRPWHEYCDPSSWHPAANIFPLMPNDELQKLADDIKTNGQKNAIILVNDAVLDGRNRLLACQLAGVRPNIEPRNPEKLGSAVSYVLSQNLHRRQLTVSQRAAVAVEAEKLFAEEIKQREHARKTQAQGTKANLPESSNGQARDKAARLLGVSGRSVQDAKKVATQSPALLDRVKTGEVSLARAVRDSSKLMKFKVPSRDLKARYSDKNFYRRIATKLDAECSDPRLDELAHVKTCDWSPAAAEGLASLIQHLYGLSERAQTYARVLKSVLREHK